MKTCSQDGCPNNAVKDGICINHGATRKCTINGCVKPLWMAGKCSRHHTIATTTSTTVPTSTAAPTTICTTITNTALSSANHALLELQHWLHPVQSPTCIDMTDDDKCRIDDLPIDILQNVLQFAGGVGGLGMGAYFCACVQVMEKFITTSLFTDRVKENGRWAS